MTDASSSLTGVPRRASRAFAMLVALAFLSATAWAQTGHVLNGVGPVDQAWGGAGMANPQDGLTALHWNPASITTLPGNSLDLSLQMLIPTGDLASTVEPGAFGPFGPPVRMSGDTNSEAGPFPIPAVGFVYAPDASRWAFGLSAFGVGGFGVDHPLDPTNPILTPQPPGGMGFGSISSEFALLQVSPTAAYRLSDKVSIGFAPTLNYATLRVTPFPAAPPSDANGDGFPTYSAAPKTGTLGYGFQVGLQITDLSGFNLGASFKSNQNFDPFEFNGQDEAGNPRTFSFDMDYPMIVSAGLSYTGLARWTFVADVRYIDFEHTNGFDQVGFDQVGAVKGFGWKSIMVVATGLQYDLTPRLPVRLGYAYNDNPIGSDVVFFNTPSPAIIRHHLAGGFSYVLSKKVTASFAAQYGFKNDVNGHWQHPQFGTVPGTSVDCELSTLTFIFGVHVGL